MEDWLFGNGIYHFYSSLGGEWITVSLTVEIVEQLLDTEYHIFHHEDDKEVLIRALEWSLPRHLHNHIEVMQTTNSFWRPNAQDKYGGVPRPAWDVEGRIPTHEELQDEDLIDRAHLDIPNITDVSSHPAAEEACNRLAISPLCLRTLYEPFITCRRFQRGIALD